MTIKRVIWGLVAVVAAVVVAGVAIIMSLDRDMIRARLVTEVEAQTGRRMTVEGPLEIGLSLSPSVVLSEVTFPNAAWGRQPTMAKIKRFEVGVALLPLLSREIVLTKVVLDGADIFLEVSRDGQVNWDFKPDASAPQDGGGGAQDSAAKPAEPAASAAGTGGLGLVVESLEIRDSQVVFQDDALSERLALKLEKAALKSQDESLDITLVGAYQDTPFALKGRTGSLRKMTGPGAFPVNLEGTLGDLSLAVNGNLRNLMVADRRLTLEISLAGENLTSLDKLAKTSLPDFGPLSFDATLRSDKQDYLLEGFTLRVNRSDLAGDVKLAFLKDGRVKLLGDLRSERIDLADFQAPDSTTRSTAATAADGGTGGAADPDSRGEYIFTDQLLPLDGLKAADAALTLKIRRLVVEDRLEAENLTARVALTDGRLELSDLGGSLFKGQLRGSTLVDASKKPAEIKVDVDFDGFDYGALLKAQQLTEDVSGTLDVNLNLSARGNSPRALVSSLSGESDIVGQKGVISHKLFAIVSSDLSNIMSPLMGDQDAVPLNCLASRFLYKDGLATSKAQVFDADTFALAGGGTIDLRTEKLDMGFDSTTRVKALVSLALPFLVKGSLKAPLILPDPVGTALFAAKIFATGANPLVFLGATLLQDRVLDGGNPCIAALEQAESGAPAAPATLPEKVLDDADKAIGGAAEGVGNTLKGLFGN